MIMDGLDALMGWNFVTLCCLKLSSIKATIELRDNTITNITIFSSSDKAVHCNTVADSG